MTYSVYVMRDAVGAVLYVGVTTNLAQRTHDHRRKPWFPQVDSTAIEATADNKIDALRLERETIARYTPAHNVAATPLMSAIQSEANKNRRPGLQARVEVIRQLRLMAGYSLRALGSRAGVNAATILRIEDGTCQPRPATLRAIADALSVPLPVIIDGRTESVA